MKTVVISACRKKNVVLIVTGILIILISRNSYISPIPSHNSELTIEKLEKGVKYVQS